MKVVILCGGKGTRLGFETKIIPKPMAKIDKDPIVLHIINYYKKFGFSDFILALGYKGKIIKKYFNKKKLPLKIQCIDTGANTLTGGRLLKLKNYLKDEENFMLTYGDGLTNQNLKQLINFHLKNNKVATMTIVRPPVRFGEVKMKGAHIKKFMEKLKLQTVGLMEDSLYLKEIFEYLGKGNEMLERSPMTKLSKKINLQVLSMLDFGSVWTHLVIKNF